MQEKIGLKQVSLAEASCAVCAHDLYDPEEEGSGILVLLHKEATENHERSCVLEAWLATSSEFPFTSVGIALVSRAKILDSWGTRLDVFVAPASRGQGVGTELLKKALKNHSWAMGYHTEYGAPLYSRQRVPDAYGLSALIEAEFDKDLFSDQVLARMKENQIQAMDWAKMLASLHPSPCQESRPTIQNVSIPKGIEQIHKHYLYDAREEGCGISAILFGAAGLSDRSNKIHVLDIWVAQPSQDSPDCQGVVVATQFWLKSIEAWYTRLDVFVSPRHRRQGLGTALIKTAVTKYPWAHACHTPSARNLCKGLPDSCEFSTFMEQEFDPPSKDDLLFWEEEETTRFRAWSKGLSEQLNCPENIQTVEPDQRPLDFSFSPMQAIPAEAKMAC